MYLTLCLVVLLACVSNINADVLKLLGHTCVEGKDNKPGVVKTEDAGTIDAIKLVHASGSIRCAGGAEYDSNFGCHDYPSPEYAKDYPLNIIVTNEKNEREFPTIGYKLNPWDDKPFWYAIDGVNARSKEIVLSRSSTNCYHVNKGQQLKVWYGEDLYNMYEANNVGRVCYAVYASYYWIKLGQTCVKGKGNKPGVVKSEVAGSIVAIKLVYASGFIRCGGGAKYNSNFGCHDYPKVNVKDYPLNILVTNEKNEREFPTTGYTLNPWKDNPFWYAMDGVNSRSKEIVLPRSSATPFNVNMGQQLKVWYGEDLYNKWETSNVGRVCYDVYAKYA